jgi:FtsH-binding integral membrane protein
MQNDVFNRTHTSDQIIHDVTYNMVIGLVLCWGFVVNWFMVKTIAPESILQFGFWPFIIFYFVCAFAGVMIFTKSEKPFFSFIGYNLVVVPFGLTVNISVSQYSPEIVQDAILVTGFTTGLMMVLGSLYPKFFFKISGALGVALISVIIVEVVGAIFFNWSHGIMDYIVVVIFCGYIGYDWARANSIPKTFDNAIDSAASIYMDIIILFTRILRIMGRR